MASKYVLKKAKNGKFFFNLQASNGQPILTSEMYDAVQHALDGVASVRKNGVVETNFEKLVAKDGSAVLHPQSGQWSHRWSQRNVFFGGRTRQRCCFGDEKRSRRRAGRPKRCQLT